MFGGCFLFVWLVVFWLLVLFVLKGVVKTLYLNPVFKVLKNIFPETEVDAKSLMLVDLL